MSDNAQHGCPLARSEDLLVEEVGSEIVVYDGVSKQAHCLTPLGAVVFAGSDGRTSVADLAGIASARLGEAVDVGQVEHTLDELDERNLLVTSTSGGMSRRQMLGRTALVGGGAVVATVLTPAYGSASSHEDLSELSHLTVAYNCGGTIYVIKWSMETTVGVIDECGTGEGFGGCQVGVSGGCPPDTTQYTVTESTDSSGNAILTLTFPTTCTVTDWSLKCGTCVKTDVVSSSSGTLVIESCPS